MSNKTQLQENNVKLQSLLNTINALPDPIPDDLGNATTDKVLKGYTFSSNNGIKLTGNMVLPIGLYLGNPPAKTVYQYNEPLAIEGMTVILKVWDGTQNIETDVTEDCTFTPEVGTLMTTVGFNQLKATYEYNGLTYTVIQDLEVENTLQSIAVTQMPSKIEYTKTEGLDITGLVVTATYATGATADVTNLCIFVPAIGETFTSNGEQNVQISYTEGGITEITSYTVEVKGKIIRYGSIDPLPVRCSYVSGGSTDNYAIFVGGLNEPATGGVGNVTAYSEGLVRQTLSGVSAKYNVRSATLQSSEHNYTMFAGGYNRNPETFYNTVDIYNEQLVKNSSRLSTARYNVGAASAGDYAIFAGGEERNTVESKKVSTVNSQFVSGTAAELPGGIRNAYGVSIGDYALFGGETTRARVSAYNSQLVYTSAPNASSSSFHSTATTGSYALVVAGNTVDTFNESLVKGVASNLSVARQNIGASSVKGFALFAGGNWNNTDAVDVYDVNLVHTIPEPLSAKVTLPAGANVGNYALFSVNVSGQNGYMDVYQLA